MSNMSDEEQIRELQQAYCTSFDARDAEAYAALYTEDAVVLTPWGQELRGREKMAKGVRKTPPGGWHKVFDPQIEFDGNTARGTVRFSARAADGEIDTGYYEDRYRRTPEGWQFTYRRVVVESRPTLAPARPS